MSSVYLEFIRVYKDLIGLKKRYYEKVRVINNYAKKTKKLKLTRQEYKNKITDLKKEKGVKEVELKEAESEKAKFEKELIQAKAEKQVKALEKEINFLKKKISEIEDVLLELTEKEENMNLEIEKIEEEMKDQLKIKDSILREYDEIEDIKKEMEKIEDKLNTLSSSFPKKVRSAFYSIIEKYPLNPFSRLIENNACENCGVKIAPAVAIKIKKQYDNQSLTEVILCPNCQRLLYIEAEK